MLRAQRLSKKAASSDSDQAPRERNWDEERRKQPDNMKCCKGSGRREAAASSELKQDRREPNWGSERPEQPDMTLKKMMTIDGIH